MSRKPLSALSAALLGHISGPLIFLFGSLRSIDPSTGLDRRGTSGEGFAGKKKALRFSDLLVGSTAAAEVGINRQRTLTLQQRRTNRPKASLHQSV